MFDSLENPSNNIDDQAPNVSKEVVCFDYLKNHKILTHPEKAEFLMLFGALLESKIKSKIKKEINQKVISYRNEIPTLITRCRPHKQFLKKVGNHPYENYDLLVDLQNSTRNLAEFIVDCFTYNSSSSIYRVLSDFALLENYRCCELMNFSERPFDLQNCIIREFFDQRNDVVHDVISKEIDNVDYVQNNLENVYSDILSMISRALQIRGITIDNLESPEKNDIVKFQSNWVNKILNDLENFDSTNYLPSGQWGYAQLFNHPHNKKARKDLKLKIKEIKKKLEASKNV